MKKTVVITGAGGGIGRCHALAFAKLGHHVLVNDLGVERDGSQEGRAIAQLVAEEIREAGGSATANTDSVATREGAEGIVNAALEHFGRIDVLVNNAGILRDRSLLKMDDEEWQSVIDVHLKGSWLCTQVAGRVFKSQGEGGVIINTTSTSGVIGNFGQANYGAAKSGIAGLTRVTAIEFARMNVRCNAIMPLAKTRMTEELEMIPEEMRPEDISPFVTYLASDFAKDVTGRVFGIWGGEIKEYAYEESEGVKFEESPSIEDIHQHWDKISKTD